MFRLPFAMPDGSRPLPDMLRGLAADRRAADARWDATSASFTVPARTVGVWVVE